MPEELLTPSVQTVSEFIIAVNGTEIPSTIAKVSVNITSIVNKIPMAIIVVQDGDPATGAFPLSDGDLFTPGNTIEISAGEPEQPVSLFRGVIIKQSLKIRNGRAPQLLVECRHKIFRSSLSRKNACFHDKEDADIIRSVLEANGLDSASLDIEATGFTHKEMVQYNCSDWDFVLSRAEANGKLILAKGDNIAVRAASLADDAVYTFEYGSSVIELDAEIDSRSQYPAVKARSWNMADQAIAEADGEEPAGIPDQGTLKATELAGISGLGAFVFRHSGAISKDEMQIWADARMQKSRLAKIRGRAKVGGISGLHPGDVIALDGLGARFNGKAFVSGVRQDYDALNGWKTQVQFGDKPGWFTEEESAVGIPKAGGLLPGVTGLHTGIVTDNEDPEGEQRVRVKMPFISEDDDGVWARMALADAGNERGLFFRPETGDEVVLGFLFDDPRQPVILGMLHSSALPPPLNPSNDNHLKGYTSREKLKLTFDDDIKEIRAETPGTNKVYISDDKQGIRLEDQNDTKITTDPSTINIKDAKGNLISIDISGGLITVKANTKVVVDAPQIELVDSASHPLVFGDELLTYLNQIVNIYQTHMHPGELALGSLPVSPAPPVPPMPPATPALLSFKVKTG